jgi:hypothetical protein
MVLSEISELYFLAPKIVFIGTQLMSTLTGINFRAVFCPVFADEMTS